MKKNYKKETAKKLMSYSAMATAIVAFGSDSLAQVVYTDVDDVTINIGDSLNVDMDNNGIPDFRFRVGSRYSGNWTFASAFGQISSQSIGGPSNFVIGYSGAAFYYASKLNSGDEIGGAGPFIPAASTSAVLASNYYGASYGQFGNMDEQFMGVQFAIDGDIHYGWMRVNVTLFPATVTLIDYAYDAGVGVPINAGQMTGGGAAIEAVPAFVKSVYSYNNMLYVNVASVNTTTVEVYTLTGEKIYSNIMYNLSSIINLEQASAGTYLIKLTSDSGTYSKKVFIGQ